MSSLLAQAADINNSDAESPYIVGVVDRNAYAAVGPLTTNQPAYDASDVIDNLSVTNLDLSLLKIKKTLLVQLSESDLTLNHPLFQFSAGVGGQIFSIPTFTPNGAGGFPTAGIDLSGLRINSNAIINPWVTGFMAISGGGDVTPSLQSGFLTVGNLTVSPFYFSLGQMTVPFTYSPSGLTTAALPASMMTIDTPTAIVGYSNNNFMAAIYGYTDPGVAGKFATNIRGGAESYYTFYFGQKNASSCEIGGGLLNDVSDAGGFQKTFYSTTDGQFGGFGTSKSSNALIYTVGAADVNAKIHIARWKLIGEYVSTLGQFATQDLSFNHHGAAPGAARLEVRYSPAIIPKKYGAYVATAWDHTMQALALNFEQNKYALVFNTAVWRETGLKLEYDRQQDYSGSDTSSGLGATAPIVGTGRGVNSISAELWVYF